MSPVTQPGALGLLGGAFDPVHCGHLRMAIECGERLQLQQVHLVPTGQPVHRAPARASAGQRLAMLQLAVAGEPGLGIETCELEQQAPSYTFDTLSHLRERYGAQQTLVWIIGLDAFLGLPGWHRWRELLQLAHLAVVRRPGYQFDTREQGELAELLQQHATDDVAQLHAHPAGSILQLELPVLDIASSAIRQRLAQHQNIRHLLPEPVREFINSHNLYTSGHHGY